MRFLVDCQILDAVQQLVQREGELLAAVAFWGRGAGQQTGIAERAKPTRILCDLLSGACNPAEITCLRRNVHVEVKYRPHLHAKVWMNGNEVVVGSANASMNGLGFENGASNIEGAVHLCDEEVAQNVQDWFCREWDLAECVDDALLETATELWNQTRNRGGAIMNCRIIAYEASKLSEEARGRFGQIAPSHYTENDLGEIHDRAEGDSHPPTKHVTSSGQMPHCLRQELYTWIITAMGMANMSNLMDFGRLYTMRELMKTDIHYVS